MSESFNVTCNETTLFVNYQTINCAFIRPKEYLNVKFSLIYIYIYVYREHIIYIF